MMPRRLESVEEVLEASRVISRFVNEGCTPWGSVTPGKALEALLQLTAAATASDKEAANLSTKERVDCAKFALDQLGRSLCL